MVVVDTSVFSLFLRRDTPLDDPYLAAFLDLFERDQIILLGTVYQELLSGVRHDAQFQRLATTLTGFDLIVAISNDHFQAAKYYNVCRTNGVQGSPIDFLICAMAAERDFPILTIDADFTSYAQHIPIQLITP